MNYYVIFYRDNAIIESCETGIRFSVKDLLEQGVEYIYFAKNKTDAETAAENLSGDNVNTKKNADYSLTAEHWLS